MNLSGGEARHRYDEVGSASGVARKLRETLAELRCGVFACHDEQVVKRRDGSFGIPPGKPLIEPVKECSSRRYLIQQQTATAVARKSVGQRSKDSMRAVHPPERLPRMSGSETVEDLPAVHTYTTELSAGAISGVERDGQASL